MIPPGAGITPAAARADTGGAGFTLLEILVALVVLGFLLAGLSQGVQFGLTAWNTQTRFMTRRGDLEAVDRTLRRLMEQMNPGTRTDAPLVSGASGRFAFTSVMPIAGSDGETADMLLLLDNRHRLLLRWTPHLHAKRVGPPPSPRQEELLGGVDRLEFAYWQPGPAGGRWISAWHDANLPALVRIRLAFPSGDPRHWPDIVAAPLRSNPES